MGLVFSVESIGMFWCHTIFLLHVDCAGSSDALSCGLHVPPCGRGREATRLGYCRHIFPDMPWQKHSAMRRCVDQPGHNFDSYSCGRFVFEAGWRPLGYSSQLERRSMCQHFGQCSWHHIAVWRIHTDNKQRNTSFPSFRVSMSLPIPQMLCSISSISTQIKKLGNWWGGWLGEKVSRTCKSWNLIGRAPCFLQRARWHNHAILPAVRSHDQWRCSTCHYSFDIFFLQLLCRVSQQRRGGSP